MPTMTPRAAPSAGGAALEQMVLATVLVGGILAAVAVLLWRHRQGADTVLSRAAARAERISGIPGWAILPSLLAAVSLLVALAGLYWDVALHIGRGRDDGPLANPAHYPILFGLIGVLASGWVAISLPRDTQPGPAPIRLAEGWQAPVGGVLIAACGSFALLGFPLDDLWHRLFGQDVTLWGPTHLMMLGGAAMTLVGQAVLLREGMWARSSASGGASSPSLATRVGRVALMAGLLLGVSIFQAEFDFGVPQYRLVLHPILIATAAGFVLVAARIWVGRGGALAAAIVFLTVRGALSLLVGPILGETAPAFPLYLGAAVAVELTAQVLGRARPLPLGVAAGAIAGPAAFATEWAWSRAAMPLQWTAAILPEGLVLAVVGGAAGGVLGALLGTGLGGRLPRPAVVRAALAGSLATVIALFAAGLHTAAPTGSRASIALAEVPGGERRAVVEARVSPPALPRDAEWLTVTSWQGGGLVVTELEPTAAEVWRSTDPVPLHGEWKTSLRINSGTDLVAAPIFMPADDAIPAPEVPARDGITRGLVPDKQILQREARDDVPGWLWSVASGAVLVLGLGFTLTLAWGVGRVGREPSHPAGRPRRPARDTDDRCRATSPAAPWVSSSSSPG